MRKSAVRNGPGHLRADPSAGSGPATARQAVAYPASGERARPRGSQAQGSAHPGGVASMFGGLNVPMAEIAAAMDPTTRDPMNRDPTTRDPTTRVRTWPSGCTQRSTPCWAGTTGITTWPARTGRFSPYERGGGVVPEDPAADRAVTADPQVTPAAAEDGGRLARGNGFRGCRPARVEGSDTGAGGRSQTLPGLTTWLAVIDSTAVVLPKRHDRTGRERTVSRSPAVVAVATWAFHSICDTGPQHRCGNPAVATGDTHPALPVSRAEGRAGGAQVRNLGTHLSAAGDGAVRPAARVEPVRGRRRRRQARARLTATR